jgi:hypothetical protein
MEAAVKLGGCAFAGFAATGGGASISSCWQEAVSNHHPRISVLCKKGTN